MPNIVSLSLNVLKDIPMVKRDNRHTIKETTRQDKPICGPCSVRSGN